MIRILLWIFILACAGGCAQTAIDRPGPAASAGPPVTRQEVMETARAYAQHSWQGTEANVFHGTDAAGVRVDTPDAGWCGPGGWYADGRTNIGVPYSWGGDSTLAEFDAGIKAGRPAGCHLKKMRRGKHLDPPSSSLPVGVDCSGFVSRCWELKATRSTYNMAGVCDRLKNYDELQPGDALNKSYGHIILFAGWADDERDRMRVFEAGDSQETNRPENYERVHEDVYNRAWLARKGYVALRYRNIMDGEDINDAARMGNLAEVNTLLRENPSLVSTASFDGWTPLEEAADNGYYDIAKVMAANHADLNVKAKGGRSPLYLAVMYDHADIVKLLLDHQAEANVKDDNGVTPLHLAAWDGDTKIAAVLLAHGADVNATDKAGETPLAWARERGDRRMIKLLRR